MLKFDVNIQALFTELPLLDRFEAASKAGFTALEMSVPYLESPVRLKEQLDRSRTKAVLINAPGGDPHTQRGLACQPELRAEFRASLDAAIEMATALQCPLVHCAAGFVPPDTNPDRLEATYLENIALAAELFASAGLKLGIEPINALDLPGFYLSTAHQALDFVEQLDRPNIGLILDLYHLARSGEDISETFRASAGKIFHVQIADAPGKGEPGTGTIDFDGTFSVLRDIGYDGWIGLEYRPRAGTLEGLSWMNQYLPQSRL